MIAADTVALPGGRSVQVYRGGTGRPVVYLHAIGGITPADPFVAALAERHAVIAPVAPGFNALEELDDIRDVHDLALHYDDLFDALGLDGVPVVGHSFGGMVGAELAAHVPHRVAKLVLISAVGLWNPAYPVADIFATPMTELNPLLWGDLDSPAAQAAATMMAALADREKLPDLIEGLVDMLVVVTRGFTSAGKFMMPIPDKGLSRRLRRITADTLVVWGSKDALAPVQYAHDFARGIAKARVEVLEGAGHMVTLERTEAVLGLIDRFVGR
jgi:pimeloyl-ACP methyl ester carboxylesterase